MKASPSLPGLLFLVPVILLWAATPLLVSELSAEMPSFQINVLATAFCIVSLSAVALVTGRLRALRADSPGTIRRLLGLGLVGIFPYTLLYYLAFSLAPEAAGSVNIVNYLWPIWVVILSGPLLGEATRALSIVAVAVSFTGVVVLIAGGGSLAAAPVVPYAIAGAGAFFWGLFSVLSKRHRHEPITAAILYSSSAVLGFAAVALIASAAGAGALVPPSPRGWLLLALLGGGVNAFGYLFWTLALRHGETGLVSSLVYLVPFVALAYLRLFRGERVRAVQLAALALVVAGPLLLRAFQGRPDSANR